MPRIDTVRLVIETGNPGTDSEVRIKFNGHELPLHRVSGGTGAGQTYEGTYDVGSFAHSVFLLGPKSGSWNVRKVRALYEGFEPRTQEYADQTLKPGDEVDIWTPPPPPAMEV